MHFFIPLISTAMALVNHDPNYYGHGGQMGNQGQEGQMQGQMGNMGQQHYGQPMHDQGSYGYVPMTYYSSGCPFLRRHCCGCLHRQY